MKVESALQNPEKIETSYNIKHESCDFRWNTISEKVKKDLSVQLINKTECSLTFNESSSFHESILKKITKDYSPSSIKSIRTGSFRSLEPSGSWNVRLAKNSEKLSKSGLSANEILMKSVLETKPHEPFKQMLKKSGLDFEVYEVKKSPSERMMRVFYGGNQRLRLFF